MLRARLRTPLMLSVLVAAVALASAPASPGARGLETALHANVLVRIDPRLNTVTRVFDVGSGPAVAVVAGRDVWVYSDSDRTVSELDAATGTVRRSIFASVRPVDLAYTAGPVMAADAGGAWLGGFDEREGFLLMRVPTGRGAVRTYALDVEPRAVAVGAGSVWVLGHRPGDNELIRIHAATGEVTGQTWFPDAGRVDSLSIGLHSVFVTSSASAALYRVDARTMELLESVDLGLRAGRPRVAAGLVWVAVSDQGGKTLLLHPRTLEVLAELARWPLREGYDSVAGFGSAWTTDRAAGTIVRWDADTRERAATIRLTPPPRVGGLCETDVAAGDGAVWVTLAASVGRRCVPRRAVKRAGG